MAEGREPWLLNNPRLQSEGLEIRSRFEIDRHRAQARPLVLDVPLYPFVGSGTGTDSQIVSGLEVPSPKLLPQMSHSDKLNFHFAYRRRLSTIPEENSNIYSSQKFTHSICGAAWNSIPRLGLSRRANSTLRMYFLPSSGCVI